jgi:hypothetical protein
MHRWKLIGIIVLHLAVAFSPTVYFHVCCCGSEQSWFIQPDDCCEDDHHAGIGNCCEEASIQLNVDDWTPASMISKVFFAVVPQETFFSIPPSFIFMFQTFAEPHNHAPPIANGKRYLVHRSLLFYDENVA